MRKCTIKLRTVIVVIIFISFAVFLRRNQTLHDETEKVQQCVPHTELEQHFGLPAACDDSQLILDCEDPYIDYMQDPHVLASCHVANISSVTELRAQVKKLSENDGSKCSKRQGILVSNPSLPVNPWPQSVPGMVPNVVHYVSIGCNRTFFFFNFLSVLSVQRFVKPDRIYFHGDCLPKGHWWQRTLQEVPNIYFRERMRTKLIQGRPPMWVEHETDIIRLQVLLDEGGIYLDTDVLVLAPLDDLRPYQISLGREYCDNNTLLGSSFILAQPRTPFMCLWLYAFREYAPKPSDWSKYATLTPGKISKAFPQLVHVERTRFYQPSWFEVHKIYSGYYDWSKNYILHMWNSAARRHTIPSSPQEIPEKDKMNCTLHEVFRYIYFNESIISAKRHPRQLKSTAEEGLNGSSSSSSYHTIFLIFVMCGLNFI